jgi:hypothetical protein
MLDQRGGGEALGLSPVEARLYLRQLQSYDRRPLGGRADCGAEADPHPTEFR